MANFTVKWRGGRGQVVVFTCNNHRAPRCCSPAFPLHMLDERICMGVQQQQQQQQLIDPFGVPKLVTGTNSGNSLPNEYWFARKLNPRCSLLFRFPLQRTNITWPRGEGNKIARRPAFATGAPPPNFELPKRKNSLNLAEKTHSKQTHGTIARRRRRRRSGHALYKINWAYLLEFIKRFTAHPYVQPKYRAVRDPIPAPRVHENIHRVRARQQFGVESGSTPGHYIVASGRSAVHSQPLVAVFPSASRARRLPS